MKKLMTILMLLTLLLCGAARAQEAEDLTGECAFRGGVNARVMKKICDN